MERTGFKVAWLLCVVWAGIAVAAETPVGDVYPLDKCIVSGAKLGGMGAPVIYSYKGREIRFCCSGCTPKFEADPEKYIKQIDAAIIEQQKPYYPLHTCVVTGEKLDKDAVDYVSGNRLVRFCCKACIATLEKDRGRFIAKLDEAVIAKQKAGYPLGTCVVSGDKLGSGAVDYVSGNRLLRFCCKDCIAILQKDPVKYLSKLDEAGKAKAKP